MTIAVVLRHVEIEGPGLLEDMLKERGIDYHIVDATAQAIPKADILIPMGGPMSVNDNHPWLRKEIEVIRRHIEWGGYAFGTCLGAQEIAEAIGGKVTAAGFMEVGNYVAELTEEGIADRVFVGIEAKVPVFHWHGETFSKLPQRAIVLATGNGLNQAFRCGNAYGVQFHWEATQQMVRQWICADPFYVERVRKTPERVMQEFHANSASYRNNLQAVFGRFLQIATR